MYSRRFVTENDRLAYQQRSIHGPCFICELIANNHDYKHHMIYEDDETVVFLNRYPILYGHILVAPRAHLERVTGDFTLDEFLSLQSVLYQVSEALKQVVPTERMYILSLGSQQGNKHVHWHITPLPTGIPYEEQQLEALKIENGILEIPDEDMASLAKLIRSAME